MTLVWVDLVVTPLELILLQLGVQAAFGALASYCYSAMGIRWCAFVIVCGLLPSFGLAIAIVKGTTMISYKKAQEWHVRQDGGCVFPQLKDTWAA